MVHCQNAFFIALLYPYVHANTDDIQRNLRNFQKGGPTQTKMYGNKKFDVVVTSAANNGNSAALRFDGLTGQFIGNYTSGGDLTDPRDIVIDVIDPSTVLINGGDDNVLRFEAKSGKFIETFTEFPILNAGGSVFGPDHNYYAGARSLSSILRFDGETGEFIDEFVPSTAVDFPRGFTFGSDGNFYLGNGADPATGSGGGSVNKYDGTTGILLDDTFVADPELSPLDVIDGLDGNIYVSSEFPFRDPNGKGTVRIYDINDGTLLNVLDPGLDANGKPLLAAPRGMGFGPDNNLYVSSTGTESVLRFDGTTGEFIDTIIEFPKLNGQALNFVPSLKTKQSSKSKGKSKSKHSSGKSKGKQSSKGKKGLFDFFNSTELKHFNLTD